MTQNPVFVYSAMLSIVCAIVLWANFYVKLLMSSAKAAVNSFDECNEFEKAALFYVIVYDNVHGIRCENKGTTKYPSSAVRRKCRKSEKYRILKMQNQYPHEIKSPKPKQANAWRSNSVPNVFKKSESQGKSFKSNLSGDIETNPGPVVNSTKTIQVPYSQDHVTTFGLNANTQCVAMSLASLIYNKRNGIVSSMDLVNIMNTGNELYSGLSSLSRQS